MVKRMSSEFLRKHIFTIAALLVYLAVPLIIYSGYLVSGNVMVTGDGESYLNSKSLFASGFLQGDPVLWDRYSMLGVPYLADVQNSFFYPLAFLSLLMPINLYSNVFYILTITLGGFFMYLYIKEIQGNKLIAFVTGFVFMMCTILGGERVVHQNIYSTIIWFPLILLFVQRYIRTNNRNELLFASIFMAVQFFAGFPQVAVYSDIFVALYLFVFMSKSRSTIKKSAIDILIWLGIYIMMIAIQFIPLVELMKNTGRGSITYAYFASYSADYKILPMIFYPEIYNNIYSPFGYTHSTGVDIEIYLGVIAAVFLIYAMIFHLKDKKIRNFIVFDIISLFFCMLGNIPVLGELVWKIPVLGSFRVQARMMFVYVFFTIVIFGLILSQLKEKAEAKRLFKFSVAIFACLVIVMVVVKSLAASQMAGEEMKKYFAGIQAFAPTLILTLCLIGLLAAYCYVKYLYNKKHAFNILVLAICIVNFVDVSRYSLKHSNVDYIQNMNSQANKEIGLINDQTDSEQYRSIAAIAANEQYLDTEKLQAYKKNGNMYFKFNSYNAYLTFESPSINEYIGLGNASIMPNFNNVIHQNDTHLSSASIKYIIDPYHNISKESVASGLAELNISIPDITIPTNNSALNVQEYRIDINKGEQYYIHFDATTDSSPQLFYIDFYGASYDFEECNVSFSLQPGANTYKGILSAGDKFIPNEVSLRIISQSDSDIQMSHFQIFKIQSVPFDSVYITLISNEDTLIYENINAKPIINVADHVADISEYNDYLVNQISFIENPKDGAVGNDANVEILELRNNSVKAKVTASEEVFVNHTQAMYPGWNVYIDGQRVQNYIVNNVLQGTYVSAGEHIVEFKFEPISLYIGAVVSLAGILLLLLIIKKQKNVKEVLVNDKTEKTSETLVRKDKRYFG